MPFRRVFTPIIVLVALWNGLVAPAVLADDAIDLTADRSGSTVQLSWTGGSPEYSVYRSGSPENVTDAGNRIARVRDAGYDDVPPAGGVFFYRVEQNVNCYRATADTYIAEYAPNGNFGGDPTLGVVPEAESTFLRFPLDMIPDGARVTLAELELYGFSPSRPGAGVEYVRGSWSEDTLTWNNAPPRGSNIAGDGSVASPWVRWNVTSAVQAYVDGTETDFGFRVEPGPTSQFLSFESREARNPPRLCVRWTDDKGAGLGDMVGESANGAVAVVEDEVTHFDGRTDESEFNGDPVLQSLSWLVRNKSAFGLDDPQAQLFLERIENDPIDLTGRHVFFGQRAPDNVRVEGAGIAVHLGEDQIVGATSTLLAPLPDFETPRVTAYSAEQTAIDRSFDPGTARVLGESELVVWHGSAIDGRAGEIALAWRIVARGFVSETETWEEVQFYIDAGTSETLQRERLDDEADRTGEDFDIETVNNTAPSGANGCWNSESVTSDEDWYDEDGENGYDANDDPNGEGPLANELLHTTYHYFYDELDYSSWDGAGGLLEMMLRGNVPNAHHSRTCNQMRFRDNWVTDDIVPHEFGHGVNWNNSQLRGSNFSGALGETISDTFGAFVDDTDRWVIAEDRPGGEFRSLEDPTRFNDPDHRNDFCTSADPYCCGAGGWSCDNGAVHTNSGVGNKVAYLLGEGGLHYGIQVGQLGLPKAGRLYLELAVNRNQRSSNYSTFYLDAIDVAQEWARVGRFGFDTLDACAVINAWFSVGYGTVDADCDGQPDGRIDGDGDGKFNTADNCPNISNPSQSDVDGDGLGDPCDPDADGDGLDNDEDNCPLVPNPGQADHDSNGLGNVCDDLDNDGVTVLNDNCPTVNNPNQRDTDGDGQGDPCDDDTDGDGVLDGDDNCSRVFNPFQQNSDFDNVGDSCDNCPDTDNQGQEDCNGDGVGDACQLDDDLDGVPDETDNCRCVANPDQSAEGTGLGLRCDPGVLEQLDGLREEAFLVFATEQILNEPVVVPFGPCTELCPDWLPDETVTFVQVTLDGPRSVRIVDDRGFVVANLREVTPGQHQVQFKPAASLSYLSPGLARLPWTDAQAQTRFKLREYFVEIWAEDPGVDPSLNVEVFVETTLGTP